MSKYSNVIKLFLKLVQIDSPTGEEKEIAEWVVGYLEKLHFKPIRDKHNNVFVKTKGVGESIFLNAHLDTVEPGRNIKPTIKYGLITSDKTTILGADNKVSVACLLDLVSSRNQSFRPLEILFTTSEEQGNYGAIGFERNKINASEGYVFDVFDEVGTIISCSPFYARFNIDIIGKSAHAGYPEQAKSVIPLTIKLIKLIESLRSKDLLVNIGLIGGGDSRNTVMGQMSLKGEIRSFYKSKFYSCLKKLKMLMNQKNQVKVTSEIVVENPGYRHNAREIRLRKEKIEKLLDKKIQVVESFGCSDANIFNDGQTDLTVFNLGTGIKDPHTVNERVEVKDIEKLNLLIKKLATSHN